MPFSNGLVVPSPNVEQKSSVMQIITMNGWFYWFIDFIDINPVEISLPLANKRSGPMYPIMPGQTAHLVHKQNVGKRRSTFLRLGDGRIFDATDSPYAGIVIKVGYWLIDNLIDWDAASSTESRPLTSTVNVTDDTTESSASIWSSRTYNGESNADDKQAGRAGDSVERWWRLGGGEGDEDGLHKRVYDFKFVLFLCRFILFITLSRIRRCKMYGRSFKVGKDLAEWFCNSSWVTPMVNRK